MELMTTVLDHSGQPFWHWNALYDSILLNKSLLYSCIMWERVCLQQEKIRWAMTEPLREDSYHRKQDTRGVPLMAGQQFCDDLRHQALFFCFAILILPHDSITTPPPSIMPKLQTKRKGQEGKWWPKVLSTRFVFISHKFSSVQSFSRVWLFATPWIAARQASLSIFISQSSLKLKSIESVMPSSHLILCRPLFLLPPILPSIRVFSNESTLHMRCQSTGVSALASVLPKNT